MNMKQIFTLSKAILVLALLLNANQAFSKIWTVSNNTAISAQFNNLPAAINAASNGDTIYIHGSPNGYGNVDVNKRLILIGPGYSPTNPTGLSATIQTLTLDTANSTSGASGTYIAGLYITTLNVGSGYYGNVLDNITARRNQISSTINIGYSNTEVHNWIVEENLIWGLNFNINTTPSTGILVNNNIIDYCSNPTKAIFTNNVIYSVPTFNLSTISNCIFVTGTANNSSANNTFNNNLFSSAINFTSGTNTFVPATQATTNNVDPKFNGGLGTSYLSISDYTLSALSAGHNAGTDGKDLGIYGGTGFLWGGTPPVPMVYFYNLKPNYVLSNGTLNVTVSVKNQ